MSLFSPKWFVTMFINTFITILFIYLIKKSFEKVNVPVISDVVKGV